jgi:hypothetical protein
VQLQQGETVVECKATPLVFVLGIDVQQGVCDREKGREMVGEASGRSALMS